MLSNGKTTANKLQRRLLLSSTVYSGKLTLNEFKVSNIVPSECLQGDRVIQIAPDQFLKNSTSLRAAYLLSKSPIWRKYLRKASFRRSDSL